MIKNETKQITQVVNTDSGKEVIKIVDANTGKVIYEKQQE